MDISSEIERYTKQTEIVYKTSQNFVYLAIQNRKNCLRCLLLTERDKLDDHKNLTSKVPKTHGYGNITRIISVSPKDISNGKYDVEDVLDLLEQSYRATQ
jgi:predicted transport protein